GGGALLGRRPGMPRFDPVPGHWCHHPAADRVGEPPDLPAGRRDPGAPGRLDSPRWWFRGDAEDRGRLTGQSENAVYTHAPTAGYSRWIPAVIGGFFSSDDCK